MEITSTIIKNKSVVLSPFVMCCFGMNLTYFLKKGCIIVIINYLIMEKIERFFSVFVVKIALVLHVFIVLSCNWNIFPF